MSPKPQIFLSHASADAFEATLLQFAFETLFDDLNVNVWSYLRDQPGNERNINDSLKARIEDSSVFLFLLSPHTLETGASQWMELAYADSYNIPLFVLLHHLTFEELKKHERGGIPPLVMEGQCTQAVYWRRLELELRQFCERTFLNDP